MSEAEATAQAASTEAEAAAETPMENVEDEDTELAAMKERVAEMEREAQKLRELQDAANKQSAGGISTSGSSEDPGAPMEGTEDDKMVSDSRSIYVGNVDYGASPEEIQVHFQSCGTINRVTILCDKFTGNPKGFAYVEFAEPEHVDAALAMDNSLFRSRLIKVTPKRTNIPGYNRARGGRGRGGYRGGFRGGYRGYSPYQSRGRGRGRGF